MTAEQFGGAVAHPVAAAAAFAADKAPTLPEELGDRRLFHSSTFVLSSPNAYSSALGNNPQQLQWVTHYGHMVYLPGGAAPDAEIERAWRAGDADAFKLRARQLSFEAAAKGLQYQYVMMRKGDVVMAHKENAYALGVFTHSPLEDEAMVWSSLHELGVDHEDDATRHARRSFRRVTWLRSGDRRSLSSETVSYLSGIFASSASKCKEGRAPPFYADLLACATHAISSSGDCHGTPSAPAPSVPSTPVPPVPSAPAPAPSVPALSAPAPSMRKVLYGAPFARGRPSIGDYEIGIVGFYNAIDRTFSVQWESSAEAVRMSDAQISRHEHCGDVDHEGTFKSSGREELRCRVSSLAHKSAAAELDQWRRGKRRRIEHVDAETGRSCWQSTLSEAPAPSPQGFALTATMASKLVVVKQEATDAHEKLVAVEEEAADAHELNTPLALQNDFLQAKVADLKAALAIRDEQGRLSLGQRIIDRSYSEWVRDGQVHCTDMHKDKP